MNGRRVSLAGLVGLIILTVLWASSSSIHATTFVPAQPGGVMFSALAPGANPDITVSFDIPAPSTNHSTQAGHAVTFGDTDVAIAGDAAIPTGAYVGSVDTLLDLGPLNGGCGAMAPVTYNLVDAATPATFPPAIAPAGPPGNLLANLGEDDGDLDNDGFPEFPALDNNIADGADAYPTFIAASLDPDGPGPALPIDPLARYFGVAFIGGTLISIAQFVVMPPASLTAMPNLGWMTGPWGLPTLAFVENPLTPPSNTLISDDCNFTSSMTLFGVAHDNLCTGAAPPAACFVVAGPFTLQDAVDGGCAGLSAPDECGPAFGCPCARATNPPAPAVLTWRQYVLTYRDADKDDHENPLDPCPLTVDPGPRGVEDDGDGDGIPISCDPTPFVFDGADVDGDGWLNRADNCPLVPNVAQADGDIPLGFAVPDGGPRLDGIGTACDPDPFDINGHYHATALAYHICIGPATPECSAVLDADADGIVNVSDNCIFGANPPIATFAQSQRDLTADGFVDVIGDIAPVAGAFATMGGTPAAPPGYQGRFDLNYDNFVDVIGDLAALTGVFGVMC